MNGLRICQRFELAWLLLCMAAFTLSAFGARLVEDTFEVLQTRTGRYTNVTVTTKAEDYIFILHTNGMASIKLGDLPPATRQQLGYVVAEATKNQNSNHIASVAARGISEVNQNLRPLGESWGRQLQSRGIPIKIGTEVLLTLLAAMLLFHLFFSYCCHLICLKANCPGGFLVWVPALQMIPLLRAAGMSGWWFLGCFVPILNLLVSIMWALNIVKVRRKGTIWAILLLLPGLNLLAFLYLAFSTSSPPEIPSTKFQTRALQAA
jgi:hypothetical protein